MLKNLLILSMISSSLSHAQTWEEDTTCTQEEIEYAEENSEIIYYIFDEEGNQTEQSSQPGEIDEYEEDDIWVTSPRNLQEYLNLMTAKERKETFKKAEECIREAYDYLHQAERIEDNIWDYDVKQVFQMIVCDGLAYCYGGTPAMAMTTCGFVIIEIGHCAFCKIPEFIKAKKLIQKAEKKFHEAALLQEILWMDDDAEDWM